jgi:hypothetical protein
MKSQQANHMPFDTGKWQREWRDEVIRKPDTVIDGMPVRGYGYADPQKEGVLYIACPGVSSPTRTTTDGQATSTTSACRSRLTRPRADRAWRNGSAPASRIRWARPVGVQVSRPTKKTRESW